jgi:hypothetical protein
MRKSGLKGSILERFCPETKAGQVNGILIEIKLTK